ncbi:MAG: hypothetical protein AABY22_26505, partial [Nanoarchaeota archaeon]
MNKLFLILCLFSINSEAGTIFSDGRFFPDITDSGGNVGIGSTSPQAALDVNGNVIIGGSSITFPNQTTFYFNSPLTYIKSSSNTACTEFHFNFNSQD